MSHSFMFSSDTELDCTAFPNTTSTHDTRRRPRSCLHYSQHHQSHILNNPQKYQTFRLVNVNSRRSMIAPVDKIPRLGIFATDGLVEVKYILDVTVTPIQSLNHYNPDQLRISVFYFIIGPYSSQLSPPTYPFDQLSVLNPPTKSSLSCSALQYIPLFLLDPRTSGGLSSSMHAPISWSAISPRVSGYPGLTFFDAYSAFPPRAPEHRLALTLPQILSSSIIITFFKAVRTDEWCVGMNQRICGIRSAFIKILQLFFSQYSRQEAKPYCLLVYTVIAI